jgi:ubiquinone biosynthesis protein UbiJ
MNPLVDLLFRTLETIANGASRLDPLTHARLQRLSGRRVAIQVEPSGESATLAFDSGIVQLEAGMTETPNVLLRGSPAALAGTLLGGNRSNDAVAIDGDEVLLTELEGILRDYRPDGLPPLDSLVGRQVADSLAALFEVGAATLTALGRNAGDEGRRLVKSGVRQRLLTRPDYDVLLGSLATLRVRLDRANARAAVLERRTQAGQ